MLSPDYHKTSILKNIEEELRIHNKLLNKQNNILERMVNNNEETKESN